MGSVAFNTIDYEILICSLDHRCGLANTNKSHPSGHTFHPSSLWKPGAYTSCHKAGEVNPNTETTIHTHVPTYGQFNLTPLTACIWRKCLERTRTDTGTTGTVHTERP